MIQTGVKVCDAMTSKPIFVPPDTTARECAELMVEKNTESICVKQDERVLGYITDEDIVREIAAKNLLSEKVSAREIMSTRVIFVEPDKDIYYAMMLMKKYEIMQIPVIVSETSKLVGLLTIKDILMIEPHLIELLLEKNDEASMSTLANLEGTCEHCGNYDRLTSRNEEFLCRHCMKKILRTS